MSMIKIDRRAFLKTAVAAAGTAARAGQDVYLQKPASLGPASNSARA